jgi:hypothetical protein
MAKKAPYLSEISVDVAGFTEFGRYPKISSKTTLNMIVSDGFLVPFAGHKKVISIDPEGQGRGLFNSERDGRIFAVINENVYAIDKQLEWERVGSLDTETGDVFIDENDLNQIAFCDKKNIYIYNTKTGVFQKAVTDPASFIPGYVAFHDSYFIAPNIKPGINPSWWLSAPNDGLTWAYSAQTVGTFQTKPDLLQAVIRLPGKGNQIFVMGGIVTESWQDVGAQLFPYQRSTGFNIDYGVLNPSTIAFGDSFVVWLGINEKSGPVIMYSSGGQPTQISNDGINFKLAQLINPSACYGFLFKQDGHLIYVISFVDPQDNFSLAYDFNNQKFISLSDEYMNYYIAKKVIYFNESYYFISLKDGDIYELNSKYTTFNGAEIPRSRTVANIRLPDSTPFIANNLTFTIEQGEDPDAPTDDVPGVIQKGNISIAADFPSLDEVRVGWLFTILIDNVFDNDIHSTNTGQSFLAGQEIMWNGTNWTVLQDRTARVDLSISTDGGKTFGSSYPYVLNREAYRKNRIVFWNLGYANDMVCQLKFWGLGRFVVTDGVMSVYQ